jgi:AraC-like DNA-binding protein
MKTLLGSVATDTPALPNTNQRTHTPPITRAKLCRLIEPRLRQTQHTPRFYFHEATVILLLEGGIEVAGSLQATATAGNPSLILIEPRTSLDLIKNPAENGGSFRTVMLEIADDTLTAFQRETTNDRFFAKQPVQCAVPNRDVQTSFWAVREGLQETRLSDRRLRYRLLDLLSALTERGHGFAPLTSNTTSDQLREVLGETPDRHWTARDASAELAMSEATLRRRLAKEHARFDEILLDVRMHHAMALLQSTNWSVPQIAQACGYRSRARFSDRFRDRFGQTPSTIR